MNEQYLFRGKRVDNGKWVEGWYCMNSFGKWPLKAAIIPAQEAIEGYFTFVQVDPATVGQCTGLRDKNETLCFEGDIISVLGYTEGHYPGVIEWGNEVTADGEKVGFNNDAWIVIWKDKHSTFRHDLGFWANERVEIIGNILDTPELLKESCK